MGAKRRKRQHGTGGIYKRGSSWLIKWREGGRQRYKSFTDEELARRALAKITGDVQAEGVGLPVEKPLSPALSVLVEKWLARRKVTHRSARDDAGRWKNHLRPFFGRLRPEEVDAAQIRRFVETKLAKHMNAATVGLCVRLLSTLYTDLVEQGYVESNPAKQLRRATRRLYKPTHDPKDTPFLEQTEHIRSVFLKLPELYGVAFAVGALAGLRTGEVIALSWHDVDLETRRLHVHRQVRHGKLGPLKDDESRFVPIQAALVPILKAWKLKTGGGGFCFRPAVPGRGRRSRRGTAFLKDQTLNDNLRAALKACELPETLTWYQCTRHTYASHWVLSGGSIEKLSKILGHSDIRVTMRYSHLRVDLFSAADYQQINVDLARPPGVVVDLRSQPRENGCTVVTDEEGSEVGSAVGG